VTTDDDDDDDDDGGEDDDDSDAADFDVENDFGDDDAGGRVQVHSAGSHSKQLMVRTTHASCVQR